MTLPVWMSVPEFPAWDSGDWPEQPVAVERGSLTLESIGFGLDLAGLHARTGLAA